MQTQRATTTQIDLSAAARARFLAQEGRAPFLSDWLDVVMIHYEVDAAHLQREVPFELDLHEGRAFVSLVAFTMSGLRTRRAARWGRRLFSPIGTHAFLNVRTYVRVGNETGIYFLVEYLPNRLSVLLGPVAYGLPYQFGRLKLDHDANARTLTGCVTTRDRRVRCADHISHRRVRTADLSRATGCLSPSVCVSSHHLDSTASRCGSSVEKSRATGCLSPSACVRSDCHVQVDVDATSPTLQYRAARSPENRPRSADAGSLTEFLIERYTAFTKWAGLVRRFRIWHQPWAQETVEPTVLDDSLLYAAGTWANHAMIHSANYSAGVRDVWMGRPRLMRLGKRAVVPQCDSGAEVQRCGTG